MVYKSNCGSLHSGGQPFVSRIILQLLGVKIIPRRITALIAKRTGGCVRLCIQNDIGD